MEDNDTRFEAKSEGGEAKQMTLEVRVCRILINAENCNKQGSFARSKYLNETLGTWQETR